MCCGHTGIGVVIVVVVEVLSACLHSFEFFVFNFFELDHF